MTTGRLPAPGRSRSTYREWVPPARWRLVVHCLWEQRVGGDEALTQRVLPDGRADLISMSSGTTTVVGIADEVALPVLDAGTVVRGIRLRPEAIAAVLGVDAADLRNSDAPADAVVGDRHARSVERALLEGDPNELDRWLTTVEPDPLVAAAVRRLATASNVSDVCRELSVSPRHLRRLMLAAVGMGPKAFQRVGRLQAFLRKAERGVPLSALAADAGFADQAHLTREVRRLSGVTPLELLRERGLPCSTDRPGPST